MTRFGISTAILMLGIGMMVQADTCHQDLRAMTQGDLDALQSCNTFTGTITIDGSAAEELELRGITEISGSLILTGNGALRSFQAPHLTKTNELRVINQTVLGKLNLPVLTQANTLMLSVLPALEHLDFPAGLTSADKVHIEDTRAPVVNGFKPEHLINFELISNNYLKQFDFSSVKRVEGALHIASNGNALDFQANQLVSIQTGEFRNVVRLAMPQLANVHGDLTFHDNMWSELVMDSLELVAGTLTMAGNDELVSASFAHLTKVGGALAIGNNKQLMGLDALPSLVEVDGTVDLAGHFDTFNMPSLQDVRGGMRLQTTSNKLQCSDIEHQLKGGDIRIVKGEVFSCGASMDETQLQPTLGQEDGGPANNGAGGFPITKGLVSEPNNKKAPANDPQNGAVAGAANSVSSSVSSLLAGVAVAALFGF